MSADLEWCARLVEFACGGRTVPVAAGWKQPSRVWVSTGGLRNKARGFDWRQLPDCDPPDGFGSAMLRRAANAGLIAATDEHGTRRDMWRFTTVALAEKWDAEMALSDGERAERTAAAVRRMYATNQREYGDQVTHWPVSTNLAAVPQDGIDLAVEGGLLHRVKRTGALTAPSGYLVPAEEWDTYSDVASTYEERQARAKAHHDNLVDLLHGHTGGDRRNVAHLDTAQINRLLDLLDDDRRALWTSTSR